MKIDWKRKLTSRKLWVSVASFVGNIMVAVGVADNTITQVTAVIMAGASVIAYIIGEGLADAAGAASRAEDTDIKNQIGFYTEGENDDE